MTVRKLYCRLFSLFNIFHHISILYLLHLLSETCSIFTQLVKTFIASYNNPKFHYRLHNSPPSSRPRVTLRYALFRMASFSLSFDLQASWPQFVGCPRLSTQYIRRNAFICNVTSLLVVEIWRTVRYSTLPTPIL